MERYLRERLGSSKFDDVDKVRSRTMSKIHGKGNKTTELAFRMTLVRAGISGWEMHPKMVIGRPDFFFHESGLAVFVDGCFWHGCKKCGHIPQTRSEFWTAKFLRNQARDRRHVVALRRVGVRSVRIWEHQLKTSMGRSKAAMVIQNALATPMKVHLKS
jgi:DNA mismatch endonuclease, patch repair protein